MKYLIISIYDGAYGFSVCENGKIYKRDEIENDEKHKFYELFKAIHCYRDYEHLINKKDYDKIIICEDGGIEVLLWNTSNY